MRLARPPVQLCSQHIDIADKAGDEAVSRTNIDGIRCADLTNSALGEHRDPIGQTERLALIVGDEYCRDAELRWMSFNSSCIDPRRLLSSAENGSSSRSTFGESPAPGPGRRAAVGRPIIAAVCGSDNR